jgi:hypothetical protein
VCTRELADEELAGDAGLERVDVPQRRVRVAQVQQVELWAERLGERDRGVGADAGAARELAQRRQLRECGLMEPERPQLRQRGERGGRRRLDIEDFERRQRRAIEGLRGELGDARRCRGRAAVPPEVERAQRR